VNLERLEELLVASVDANFADEDRTELNAMLRSEPEARDFAAQFLATDALLADALEAGATEQSYVVKKQSRRLWIASAAGLVAAAALALMFVIRQNLPPTQVGEPVATIQNAHENPEFVAGQKLRSGQVLKISHGQIKIAFGSGAKLAVQAPAELKILGPNSARLQQGLVTVRVPGLTKGFALDTPAKRVVDLGTAFGVKVDPSGKTSVAVFEGEIEIGGDAPHRHLAGTAVHVSKDHDQPDKAISYDIKSFMNTWVYSFGIDGLRGDVRFAQPDERRSPGRVIDNDSLLLIPEREGVKLPADSTLNILEPGTYEGPFSQKKALPEATLVDSYLLQYNPQRPSPTSKDKRFTTEVHFDRPIIGIIAHKDVLAQYDPLLAHPNADFSGQLNRGLYKNDQVTLSADRRTIRVAFDIEDGVDQIRVLVASHFSEPLKK
jgi:hypothetical protein